MSIKGLDNFMDVVEILGNPKKYETKISELKNLVSQYTEAAEAVVKLASVNDYTQNIKKREEETKQELFKAKEEPKSIVTKANEKAKLILTEAEKVKQDAAKKEQEAKEVALVIKKLEADNEQVAKTLSEKADELERLRKLLNEKEQALAEKQAKLLAALK